MANVATLELTGRQAGKPDIAISVEIGVPYRVAGTEWACSVSVRPLHERLHDQYGEGSFQALLLAMRLALDLLKNYTEKDGALLDEDGGSFPFDAFPINLPSRNRPSSAP